MNNKLTFFERNFPAFALSRAKSQNELLKAKLETEQRQLAIKNVLIIPPRPNQASQNRRTRGKLGYTREDSRKVYNASAFAFRGVQALTASHIAWGIEPTFSHPDAAKLSRIEQEFKSWAANCTLNNTDFYSLQNLVFQDIVIDGEAVVKVIAQDGGLKLHQVNADYIADFSVDVPSREFTLEQGVLLDKNGIAKEIMLTDFQPEPSLHNQAKAYKLGSEAIHVYRRDYSSQVRGVSWLLRSIEPLRELLDLHELHLAKEKASAAISAVITSDYGQNTFAQEEPEPNLSEITSGSAVYLKPGEKVDFPSLPSTGGQLQISSSLVLREAAAGMGVTAEMLTQDWSQFSFSSSKAARIEFYKLVDKHVWTMFVPQFLTPVFEVFKRHCALKGIDASLLQVEWNPPAREMLSPADEVSANNQAIRSGQKSLKSVLREYGINPKKHFAEIAATNKELDKLGLILDSDSRRTANGQLVSPEALEAIEKSQQTS